MTYRKMGIAAFVICAGLCRPGLAAEDGAAQKAMPPAGPAIHACALLSEAEVAAVIGSPVAPGAAADDGDVNTGAYSSTCLWRAAVTGSPSATDRLAGANYAMLNTNTWPAGSGDAKKYLEDFRAAAKNDLIDMVPVPVSVGDEALWWGDGVAVRKGDISFGISVHLVKKDSAVQRQMEEALAKKIAGRL
jgi:hypothetical protein